MHRFDRALDYFDTIAAGTERTALDIVEEDGSRTIRSFAELSADSNRVANFLNAMTLELQMIARACGKANVQDLEPEDMRALTLEAALITGIPLVGMREPLRSVRVEG